MHMSHREKRTRRRPWALHITAGSQQHRYAILSLVFASEFFSVGQVFLGTHRKVAKVTSGQPAFAKACRVAEVQLAVL